MACRCKNTNGTIVALRNQRIWAYIDEVARAGSVRQAAERLNMTPSALLRRIQDVEHDLGAPLFERHSLGVRLTAAGELFIRWIRTQSAELQRVYSQIEELGGLQRGDIRIACSQAVARSFLLQQVVDFRARHPNVKFRIVVTDHISAVRQLTEYEIDLALIFRPLRHPELHPILSIGQGWSRSWRRTIPWPTRPCCACANARITTSPCPTPRSAAARSSKRAWPTARSSRASWWNPTISTCSAKSSRPAI
jgi:DNA-binding transcriptional LysR family regulator